MKLLIALLLWSQGVYSANSNASATASPSAAAAEVKGAAALEEERKAAHEYPVMPDQIYDMLGMGIRKNISEINRWLDADPNNANAIFTYAGGGGRKESLLNMIADQYRYAGARSLDPEEQPRALKRRGTVRQLLLKILDLKPDVRFAKIGDSELWPSRQQSTVLTTICSVVPLEMATHMTIVKKIIDLFIEQGANPATMRAELEGLLAEIEKAAKDRPNDPKWKKVRRAYTRGVVIAALEYLQDLQAAPILAEEMTEHRGFPPELAEMSAQYLAPSYKKPKKHSHHKKSKSNGK